MVWFWLLPTVTGSPRPDHPSNDWEDTHNSEVNQSMTMTLRHCEEHDDKDEEEPEEYPSDRFFINEPCEE